MTQVPQPVVPVCYRHPKRETYVRCTRCGRPICPDCMHEAAVGHQCPDCVAEGRRTQRPVRTAFGGGMVGARGFATITLIGVNVLMMLISLASAGGGTALFGGAGFGGLLGGLTPLMEWGAMHGVDVYSIAGTGTTVEVAAGVADGEYYRILTSMFLHYGLLHVLMNMWALWILGRTLEAALGPARFLMLYFVSGLGGSVAVYLFSPAGFTAGASGAIFGLFAALFIILKRLGRDTSSVVPILIINIAISFVPGISLAGHLGGLVSGAIVAVAIAYAPRTIRTGVLVSTVAVLLAILTVLVLVQTQLLQAATPPGI